MGYGIEKLVDKVIISMYAVEQMRESAGRMYKYVCVFMAGIQTLVGAGPAIAVFWYQGYNTTGK
ncbi:hypothetical protein DS742_03610 [Lacrimispora amygdalina]|uniref:Uncharacterized protein n=1 Tax=Lacrimispora amygdalina TaxID=253257 RepID=A0A3E2NH69_9FIRM|nr:hypothetical protein [Clostridium indicum]RFZ80347.1 hypothetical protein DS742_03610 [Clostridium indicum]